MRGADITTNIRKTVLGLNLYNQCIQNGGRIEKKVLEKRLKKLQIEGHFTDCDVDTFAKLCSLRENAPLEETNSCLDELETELEDVNDKYNVCSICADTVRIDDNGVPQGIIELHPCGHEIHRECLRDFVKSWGRSTICPICRTPVDDSSLQVENLLTLEERQARSLARSRAGHDVMYPNVTAGDIMRRDEENVERTRLGHLRRMKAILEEEDATPIDRITRFLRECKQKFRLEFPFTIQQLRELPEAREMMELYDELVEELDESEDNERRYLEDSIDSVRYIRELIADLPSEEDEWEALEYIRDQLQEDEWYLTHIPQEITEEDRTILRNAINEYGEDEDTVEMYNALQPYFALRVSRIGRIMHRRTEEQERELQELTTHLRAEEQRLSDRYSRSRESILIRSILDEERDRGDEFVFSDRNLRALPGRMTLFDLITAVKVLYESGNEELRTGLQRAVLASITGRAKQSYVDDILDLQSFRLGDVKSLISVLINSIVLLRTVEEFDFEEMAEAVMGLIENLSYNIDISRNRELVRTIDEGVKQSIVYLALYGNPDDVIMASRALSMNEQDKSDYLMQIAERYFGDSAGYNVLQTYANDILDES